MDEGRYNIQCASINLPPPAKVVGSSHGLANKRLKEGEGQTK